MTLLPELLPIERLEEGASSVRSVMSIATRLSKAGKLRRSGMLVESASQSNIQPLQSNRFRAGWWQQDAVCCGDLAVFSNRLPADF